MTTPTPKKKRITLWLIAASLGMFGFSFALVPLYNVLCEITGLNGKVSTSGRMRITPVVQPSVDTTRVVTLEFVTHINEDMPWEFGTETKSLEIHPGEMKKVIFYAKNPTNQDMVGQSIPSVTPAIAARYIQKVECFCFARQPLKAGAEEIMPVVLFIDKDLPKEIEQLTLSYTLFDITTP
jgi:cytochrome c oxidase assembly protein subunit 11